MLDPIPVVLLGRLAIDTRWQRQGLGRSLFRDAAMRVSLAAEAIGVRGIVVHAISNDARKFHLALGFSECPGEPMTLVVTLQDIRASLDLLTSGSAGDEPDRGVVYARISCPLHGLKTSSKAAGRNRRATF